MIMYFVDVMLVEFVFYEFFSVEEGDHTVGIFRHYIAIGDYLIILAHFIEEVLGEWSENWAMVG